MSTPETIRPTEHRFIPSRSVAVGPLAIVNGPQALGLIPRG